MELDAKHLIATLLAMAVSSAFTATPDKAKCSEYVGPMLGATWYQVAPQNDFAPLRYLCGCMATAGGMEYRYWRWPYRMESSRTVSHGLSGYDDQTIRVNGSVPFDYDRILASYGGVSTYESSSKSNNFEAAHLVLWMDSLTRMDFAPGYSGGSQKLATDADWYEKGSAMNKSNSDTETLWTAITNDIAFGSPIQVNRADHAMVVDGYAVETNGAGEVTARYININWGWGSEAGWMDFDNEYESNKLADFQVGFRPQKVVQFEPLAKVCGESVDLAWHIAPCYTNRIAGFSVETVKLAEATFLDDFSDSAGEASNAKFAVESGYLGGYPGQSGTYTYPESHYITTNSVLTFKETSRYMAGHAAYAEASFNGGDWQTLYTFSLTSGKNTDFGNYNTCMVDLADYAGKTMRLRFRLVCNWQGWSAGSTADFRIDDVSLASVMEAESSAADSVAADAAMPGRYTCTASGLEKGGDYAFVVAPVMADGSVVYTNVAVTTIGTPVDAPEITRVSAIGGGLELLQEGFFIECGMGITNKIAVTCNEATTSLCALPTHLSMLPDEKTSVTKDGNVFTVSLDATEMDEMYAGNMLMLTLVAGNDDGTEAYKNLMLRFSTTRQVLNGTFDVAEGGEAQDAIWLCGTNTIIDAKGKALTFKQGAFCGTGTVALADSTGGGSFAFDSLDGFTGTLAIAFDMALSQDIPANLTLAVDAGYTLTLENATIAAAIEGTGSIEITSGVSTISNATAFAGSINLYGGTLNVPAGNESKITVAGGTLKIHLDEEQTAFGYSTSGLSYVDGTVKFVDCNGNETTASSPFSFAATANTWSCSGGSESYASTSCWSWSRLPQADEYVIIQNSNKQSIYLNASSETTLSTIWVKGDNTQMMFSDHPFATYGYATYSKIKPKVLRNDTPLNISSTLLQPEVLEPSASLSLAANGKLTSMIYYNYASYMNTSDLTDSTKWLGTVCFTNYTMSGFNTASWGNANSFVRLTNASGWMANTATNSVPIILVDGEDDSSALKISNGSKDKNVYIAKLLGDGTLETAGTGGTQERIIVWDVNDFTGAVKLATKTLVIGKDIPSTFASTSPSNGRLHFCSGYGATIASNKTWTVGGGVYFDSDSQLTVNGTLDTSYLYANATGGSITLADGGTIELDSINLDGSSLAKNFSSGTFRITADAAETNAVNFCAGEGKFTTLDANGNTLAFGADAVTGSGDIYPTSSANALGAVVFDGLDDFTGTLILDGSTSVTLPDDLSASSCTISLQSVAVARNSDNVGRFTVGSSATLTIVLTADEAETGYTASDVTLAGGKIEFTDSSGNVLATSTTATSFAGTRKVWSPANGAASGNWMDEECWSKGEVATDGDSVYVQIDGDTTLNFDSTVARNFAAIIVQGSGTLTITNTDDAVAISTSVFSNETAVVLESVLELTSTGNTNETGADYSSISGTGTIRYSSTAGWRTLPGSMFASTLGIENELANGLIICNTSSTTIGSLSGTKNIRSDWDNGTRALHIKQAKDTEWSGVFTAADRIGTVYVEPGEASSGVLTLSGIETHTNALNIVSNAFVNITGKWVGDVTVADGGTLFVSGSGAIDGNVTGTIAGYMENGTEVILTNYSGAVTIPASATSIKIYYGDTDITYAFVAPAAGTTAALSLDAAAAKPDLAEAADAFVVDESSATFNVKTIPGLWYAVKSGTELANAGIGGTTSSTAGEQATGGELSLSAEKPQGDSGFYQIIVAPSEAGLGE